ncbi:nitroreductase family protein [Acinetobacter bouvetii]|uniref:Nitroreductase family protein n=1 Tax=Acinetobacter bouvetii TaxID=202951 RepID=A0A811G9V8_9GAMM|nr:nitroreductase family protein [Acinetobacter bouvetii]CAB1212306.1 Nitroreductase family protein [Acinetobacter bouvetii]
MALLEKIGHVLTADITKELKFKKTAAKDEYELTFVDHLKKRRSIYVLGKKVHFSQAYLAELIQEAVRSCPSALNSQSSRIVVLFGDSHDKFWEIVKDVQRKLVAVHVFAGTEVKINQCQAGVGTVLFYEDQKTIRQLQKKIPFNAADFPVWSEQTSGMAQYAVWTALAEAGLGACLQHYNPSIDSAVAQHFNIDQSWLLRAQLVFGSIEQKAEIKQDPQDNERFRILL